MNATSGSAPHEEPVAPLHELLSVVIPAYNVERYIGQCLGSVLPQCARHGVRVVVVIDGATDGTPREIERALEASGFAGATVITQPNAGLSAARNRGLAAVDTEYVCFLDSDDYWLDGYLDAVLPVLRIWRPDLVEYDCLKVLDTGAVLETFRITPVEPGTVREVSQDEFLRVFRCYAWARIVRTGLARARPFPAGRRFEDAATIPWYYRASARIVGIGEPLLAYRQRAGSILASPTVQDILDLAFAVRSAADEYHSSGADFWRTTANRLHQVGCGRVPLLPPAQWRRSIAALAEAVAGVPPDRGALRAVQIHWPLAYIAMLSVRRLLRRRSAQWEPRLFGRSA